MSSSVRRRITRTIVALAACRCRRCACEQRATQQPLSTMLPRMKRAVITGGSSGIGQALGRELASRGWSVALLARRTELVEQHAEELRKMGVQAVGIGCDVTDLGQVREAVARARGALGGELDLAVANAGISVPTWASSFKVDDAERILRVNVLGMFY